MNQGQLQDPHPVRRWRGAAIMIAAMLFVSCGRVPVDVGQSIEVAKAERAKGNFNAAVIQLKNAVQEAPQHPEARYQLGLAYGEMGDHPSAEKELRRALELGYDRTKILMPLARALLATGEFQKVLDELRVDEGSSDAVQAEVLALRGLAALGLRRIKEGRAELEKALEKRADLADALIGMARLAAAERKFEAAADLVERALASEPRNADALLMRADLNRALQRGDPAADYARVLEAAPQNIQARLHLVAVHSANGAYDEAEKSLAEARRLAPRNPLVLYAEGLMEFRRNDLAKAREAVLQVIKVAPNHMPSILLAGAIEYALGSHVQAQSYLQRVVDRFPGNLYARKLLIASLARAGQTHRAHEALAPGLAQAPDDPMLLNIAGELAMQENDFAKARQYLAKASTIDPKSAGARTGLAVSRLATGDAAAGLADLEAAVDLDAGRYQADVLLVASYLQSARYDQALKAVASLEKKQPDNPLTHNLKAAAYLGKKDLKAARAALERALELQPTYLPAALNLAQLDLQAGNAAAARQRLEGILEKDRENVQALLALASLAPRLGASPKEQAAWLERAGRVNAAGTPARIMLARFHAGNRDYKKALDAAQQAVAASPDNPEALDALGSIQLAAGEKNQAVATYSRLVTLQPRSPQPLVRLAAAEAASGDTRSAAESLRKALRIKGDLHTAQAMLAELESRAGRHAEALAIARTVRQQQPKSALGPLLEGDALMMAKRYSDAARSYEEAWRIGMNGPLAMKLHAAYQRAGKAAEGDARLAQWLKSAPDDAPVRFYAADVALKGGNYKAAIGHYERLYQKQPENVVILNNLAWAYQQVGDKRALEMAERAYKLKPENAAIVDTLGWMLVEQGQTARGLELLQQAVAAAPKAHSIRFHLAQAWLKAGDTSKARSELERTLVDDAPFPEQKDAIKLLKELRK